MSEESIETLQKFRSCKVVELLYPEKHEVHHTMDILIFADGEFLDRVTNITIHENTGGTSMVEIQVPMVKGSGSVFFQSAKRIVTSRKVGFRAVEDRGDFFSLKFGLQRARMYTELGVLA